MRLRLATFSIWIFIGKRLKNFLWFKANSWGHVAEALASKRSAQLYLEDAIRIKTKIF